MNTEDQKTHATNWSPLIVVALSVPLLGLLQELLSTGSITLGTKEQTESLSVLLKNLLPTITLTPPSSMPLLEGGETSEMTDEFIIDEPFPSPKTAFTTILRKTLQVTALKALIKVTWLVLGNLSAPILVGYIFPSGGQALIGAAYSVADRINSTSAITMCYAGAVHWFPRSSRVIGFFYNTSMGGVGSFCNKLLGPCDKLIGPIRSFYSRVNSWDSSLLPSWTTHTRVMWAPKPLPPIPSPFMGVFTLLERLLASSIVVSVPAPFIILGVCAFFIFRQPEPQIKKQETDIIIDLDGGPLPLLP